MLTNEFILLCRSYAEKRKDVLDEHLEDSKKLCKYNIELYSSSLEFVYVKKESVFIKPSSLYCTVKLRKNSVIRYHLTDIIPFLKEKNFDSCYFWNIESIDRLKNCFECLEETLKMIFSQISPFLSDDHILRESLFQSYRTIYNLKPNDLDFEKIEDESDFAHTYFLSLQKMRDSYIFSRYSAFKPYELILNDNTEKALAKYEKLNKQNKLLEYEKILINHIKSEEKHKLCAFKPECDTSRANKLISFVSLLKTFAVCFLISSVFFCGFCAVYNAIASIDTVLLLSAPWYVGFLCAGLCSIFGSVAFLGYIPNKHLTKTERQNFSNILISKGFRKLSFAIFVLSVAVSIFFAVMIMTSNVRFYDDSIRFDNKSYNYDQIHSIYRIDARYNIYDERLERSSYVILFEDKTSLDLDGSTSVEFTEKEVLPILKNKGYDVYFADSEKDLPWYS